MKLLQKARKAIRRKETWFAIVVIGICLTCAALEIPSNFETEAWIVIGTIGLMFDALLFDLMAAHYAMLLALAAIMFSQVITTEEALEGFSSSAVLSVAVLYVVAAGLTATGGLNYFMNKLLARPRNLAGAQLRLMLPVAMISAVMNNTPVVAIMIPIIQQWAPKANLPVSQLFIPLSFASILGGACTLIGTSTNLVVAGKAETDLDFKIGLFDIALVGIPALLTGLSYILIFAPYLLPNEEVIRKRLLQNNPPEQTNYSQQLHEQPNYTKTMGNRSIKLLNTKSVFESLTVACTVNASSPAVNKTLTQANLRGLTSLYLTSVQRNNSLLQAIGPEFVVNANDILFFTGIVHNFSKFCQDMDFTPLTNTGSLRELPISSTNSELRYNLARQRASTLEGHLFRVIVKEGGLLPGKTPSDVHFRRLYGAAIVSISCCCSDKTTRGNLGRTILKAGDELDLIIGETFDWEDENTSRDLEKKVALSQRENRRLQKEKDIEREFLISMKVAESSGLIGVTSLVGKKIVNAGLRGLPGLFLIALEREDVGIIRAVSSEEILQVNDVLWFVGERTAFGVLRQIPGLVSANNQEKKLKLNKVDRRLVECVIAMNSDMIGKTIREVRFRSRFRAAVVAVHRQGQRVLKKIGDIELRPGDVLLLDTGPYFLQRYRDDRNFLLVSEIENSGVPQFGKFYLALGLVVVMMGIYTLLQSFDDIQVSLFEIAVVASAVMIVTNMLSPARAMKSINWEVIIAIACAFGLSTALEKSGVAEAIGTGLVDLAELSGTGEPGLFAAIYLATFLVSIVVANNAAALLMFPIATQALTLLPEAQQSYTRAEVDLTCKCIRQILYTLMLAASSSFSSPFGYQTNLMVYSPGSYRFGDFLKFGLPMQFWQMAFSITFIVFIDDWYYSWVASLLLFIIVIFFKFTCLEDVGEALDEMISKFSIKVDSTTPISKAEVKEITV